MTTSIKQTPQALNLDHFFPYQLSQLNAIVSDAIAQLYKGRYQLAPFEWRVLAVLGEHKKLAAKEIGQRTHLEKMQVSRAVAGLKTAGLVTQETDSEDRRITRLQLSPAGGDLYQQIVPLVLAREAFLLSSLSDEEQQLMRKLMAKIAEQAQQLNDLG